MASDDKNTPKRASDPELFDMVNPLVDALHRRARSLPSGAAQERARAATRIVKAVADCCALDGDIVALATEKASYPLATLRKLRREHGRFVRLAEQDAYYGVGDPFVVSGHGPGARADTVHQYVASLERATKGEPWPAFDISGADADHDFAVWFNRLLGFDWLRDLLPPQVHDEPLTLGAELLAPYQRGYEQLRTAFREWTLGGSNDAEALFRAGLRALGVPDGKARDLFKFEDRRAASDAENTGPTVPER